MLANNSLVKAAISIDNGERKKAVLKAYEGRIYLLSHTRRTFEEVPAGISKHGMPGGGFVENNGRDSWEYYDGKSVFVNNTLCRISLDPETVARLHTRGAATSTRSRRATAPAPEMTAETVRTSANPYCLDNYTTNMYEGFRSYHSSHYVAMNTPTNGYNSYRIGVELETGFQTSGARSQFTDTPRNWYFCESDSSLNGSGCEMITIPLIPADAKSRATWKPICERLKALGATSWDNNRCGLHVHIGREISGDTTDGREATLSRLLLFYNLYLNDDTTATKVFGRARCYHEGRHENTQEFAAVKCLGAEVLKNKEIAKRVGDAMKAKQRSERYYTINTTNAATIEFRKGRGSLSVDRIQTIITFCEAVCLYCRTSGDVSELTLDGFREFIRSTVPATNGLYHYYDAVESDC